MKWLLLIYSAISSLAYWFSVMGFCHLSEVYSFTDHPLYPVVLISLLLLFMPVSFLLFYVSKLKFSKTDSDK